ncbi:MAG: two-component system response regulator [Chitinophaga sp.]|nr:two-component system response regulator [Chitinophaga sp.]
MNSVPIEILLVEDNHDEAELVIRNLKKNNLANNLRHIDDGVEALDFIFSRGVYKHRKDFSHPKLILLDLKLPKVSGLEILQEIKSNEETKTIPVVVLTSSKEDVDVSEAYRFGVNSYIVKPVNFESFSKAVIDIGMYWMVLNHAKQ